MLYIIHNTVLNFSSSLRSCSQDPTHRPQMHWRFFLYTYTEYFGRAWLIIFSDIFVRMTKYFDSTTWLMRGYVGYLNTWISTCQPVLATFMLAVQSWQILCHVPSSQHSSPWRPSPWHLSWASLRSWFLVSRHGDCVILQRITDGTAPKLWSKSIDRESRWIATLIATQHPMRGYIITVHCHFIIIKQG